MTDLEKAARQALEVLEENHHLIEEHERPEYLAHYDRVISGVCQAIADAEKQKWVRLTYEEIDRRLHPDNNEWELSDRFWNGVEWAKKQIKSGA